MEGNFQCIATSIEEKFASNDFRGDSPLISLAVLGTGNYWQIIHVTKIFTIDRFLNLSITETFTSKNQYGKAFQGNIVITAAFLGEIILREVLRTTQFKHKLCKEGFSRNSSHYIQHNFATNENSRMETWCFRTHNIGLNNTDRSHLLS